MDNSKVVILGSGKSILELSKEEIMVINNADIVLGLNKFCAYQDSVGIVCNVLYYHDLISLDFFILMIRRLISNGKIDGMTILTNRSYQYMFRARSLWTFLSWFYSLFCDITRLKLGKKALIGYLRAFSYIGEFSDFENQVKIIGFNTTRWNKGGNWSDSFKDELFHFRGSLGSAINCASLLARGKDIYLVGCDFNGASYFYEKEINKEKVDWKDHTYNLTKKMGMHFSLMGGDHNNFVSCISKIIKELNKRGTRIYVSNKESGICGYGKFKFKSLK